MTSWLWGWPVTYVLCICFSSVQATHVPADKMHFFSCKSQFWATREKNPYVTLRQKNSLLTIKTMVIFNTFCTDKYIGYSPLQMNKCSSHLHWLLLLKMFTMFVNAQATGTYLLCERTWTSERRIKLKLRLSSCCADYSFFELFCNILVYSSPNTTDLLFLKATVTENRSENFSAQRILVSRSGSQD